MTSIAEKAAYVRSQGQTREHTCHYPSCTRQVPPAKMCCAPHWKLLPRELQQRIWLTFRPGQEVTFTPSREYLAAARAAEEFFREHIRQQQLAKAEEAARNPQLF